MKPLVYVAGPYSTGDPVVNTQRAVRAGLELFDFCDVVPIIPHLTMLAHLIEPRDIDYWYAFDLAQLEHCDALLRLSGVSTGADREVVAAREAGLDLFFCRSIDIGPSPEMYDYIKRWALEWVG